jgi:putative salt-induced outer membrane protein YdiY
VNNKLIYYSLSVALVFANTVNAGTASSGKQNANGLTTETTSPWEVTATTGLSLTRGNAENLLFNASILASYLTEKDTLYIGADYYYGETSGTQSVNNLHGYVTYDRLINDWFYYGINNDYFQDDQRSLDYRIATVPKVGAYLVKNERAKLAIEGGFGYVWEDQGVEDSYTTFFFGEKFEYQLTSNTKFFQTAGFAPEAGDFDNYLLIVEAGIETALSEHWALKVSGRDIYDGTPAAGLEKNDLIIAASLAWSAAGFSKPKPGPTRRTLKPPAALPSPIAKGWTNTANFGFGLTSGNSETLVGTVGYVANYHGEKDDFSFAVTGAYGETNSTVNTQNALVVTTYKNDLGPVYWGAGVSFLYNDIADVDYRVNPALLLGKYLVKNDKLVLSVDVGPAFVFEKVGGVSDSYFALQASEKLEWKITDSIAIGQSVYFVPRADDLGDYQILASAYIDAAMTDDLSLRVTVSDTYDSTPAAGRDANDLLVTAGIAVRF